MTGILVVNNFLRSRKFDEIYSFLRRAAEKENMVLDVVRSGDILHSVNSLRKDPVAADFALFWDKDTVLAKQLEISGLRVFNSAAAIAICDNKALTAVRLEKDGIPTPETYAAPLAFEGVPEGDLGFAEIAASRLGFPLVVKELSGSFGQQVYLAENFEDLKRIISSVGSKGFLMQKFIKASRGRDVRVNVVGGVAVCAVKRESLIGDFRSNITLGGRASKYIPCREEADIALDACRSIGLDFAGVDVLFGDDGKPLICEVNSNPHFKTTFDATGIDLSRHIMRHIKREICGKAAGG